MLSSKSPRNRSARSPGVTSADDLRTRVRRRITDPGDIVQQGHEVFVGAERDEDVTRLEGVVDFVPMVQSILAS